MAFVLGANAVYDGGSPGTSSDTISFVVSGCTAGRSLVVGAEWVSSSPNISSITCSGESDLTLIGSKVSNSGITSSCQLAYLANITTSGDKTITITLSSAATYRGAFGYEFSGGRAADFLDASLTGTGSSADPSISLTTGEDNTLVVSICSAVNAVSAAGSAYTLINMGGSFRDGEYDLDGGTAGARAVDYTATTGSWAVAAASFNLDVNTAITGAAGTATLTGYAPSLVEYDPTPTIMPAAGELTFAFHMPTVSNPGSPIIPGSGSLALTGNAPGVSEQIWAGEASLEAMTAFGIGEPSTLGAGAATFERITATGNGTQPYLAFGSGILETLDGAGYAATFGAATLEPFTAHGVGTVPASGAGILEPISRFDQAGSPALEYVTASGVGYATAQETYATKVMNARTNAITEYTNYDFNSYAKIGSSYYGVSSEGIVLLDGDDDDGASIDWAIKTGQHDDKNPGLKRLPEVLVGLRSNGPIRVRVHKDDNAYYDYVLPAVKRDTIHQARVTPGKGMRSRWFAVELQGIAGSAAEIDSLQMLMTKTNRRLG